MTLPAVWTLDLRCKSKLHILWVWVPTSFSFTRIICIHTKQNRRSVCRSCWIHFSAFFTSLLSSTSWSKYLFIFCCSDQTSPGSFQGELLSCADSLSDCLTHTVSHWWVWKHPRLFTFTRAVCVQVVWAATLSCRNANHLYQTVIVSLSLTTFQMIQHGSTTSTSAWMHFSSHSSFCSDFKRSVLFALFLANSWSENGLK